MPEGKGKYRFLVIRAFCVPNSKFYPQYKDLPKEKLFNNYNDFKHILDDVEWDFHPGPPTTYGDWAVENREEFAIVAAGRLPIVREACESGKYNAIVLIGGGEPGFIESVEIGRKYNIPVTSCAFSQMHMASMLGNKFSVIDISELHNMFYYNLVVQHHFTGRCASIRNINYSLPRPGYDINPNITEDHEKAMRGEPAEAIERAVEEAVAAIEEDGAEVITFGCSALFWLKPFVEKRLHELGWEVPVLEGHSTAIEMAKLMVDMGLTASGLWLPGDRPKKTRRKKTF
jgi:Asp/Glu/hydantoin racemase